MFIFLQKNYFQKFHSVYILICKKKKDFQTFHNIEKTFRGGQRLKKNKTLKQDYNLRKDIVIILGSQACMVEQNSLLLFTQGQDFQTENESGSALLITISGKGMVQW